MEPLKATRSNVDGNYCVIKTSTQEWRDVYILVGEGGLEPPLHCWNQILSLARLPIPPLALNRTLARNIKVLYNKTQ